MIILLMWATLVDCPTKAKLGLIPETISKGGANNSLQCGLASKQFHKAIIQNIHTKIDMHLRATRNAFIAKA